eukprot:g14045.t1
MKAVAILVVLAAATMSSAVGRCPKPQQLRRDCVCASLYKRPDCKGQKLRMDIPFNASIKRLVKPFRTFSTVVVAKGCRLMAFAKAKYKGTMRKFKPGMTRLRKGWRSMKTANKVASLC